ncbi:MAG: ABC transporter ATP-binding protein [Brachymonas sp.]
MTHTLQFRNITKRFGSLVANDDISLEVRQGEILALLGENGAGKSTLVSILFGHYTADSGSIEVGGLPLKPGDPKAALKAGIGIVHQHFALADNLSVLDNVMLGTESLWAFATQRGAARAHLLSASEQFGLRIEPDALVGSLSVGQKQRVEILKTLYRGAKILILDEPTAVLTPQESESLFAMLHTLVARGMSIIFISHKLAEVLRVSDRVAVLRQGKLVALSEAKEATQQQLALWMVGHEVTRTIRPTTSTDTQEENISARPERVQAPANPSTSARRAGLIACELRQVSAQVNEREQIKSCNLKLLSGQITAIAGVSGNGQLALAQVLCGQLAVQAGELWLSGKQLTASAAAFVQAGVARIPEDRKGTGVLADLSLWENAVSEQLALKGSMFHRAGFVRERAARAQAQRIVERFDVRGQVSGKEASGAAARLSGGNMQKLILGRALMRPDGQPPILVVAHQPTWGLDVGAVSFVHEQLRVARDAGAAVLLISDDLDEILELADEIAVIHSGFLSPARTSQTWTREQIGMAMAGNMEAVA